MSVFRVSNDRTRDTNRSNFRYIDIFDKKKSDIQFVEGKKKCFRTEEKKRPRYRTTIFIKRREKKK